MTLVTSTGSIAIELPHGAAADVVLSTSVGGIELRGAPEVRLSDGVVGRRAEGRLGGGGPALSATTSVGGIRLAVGE
jgi:hypothetical protein